MLFQGLFQEFSTRNEGQYEAIGAFWDAMSERFGRENLQGLGFGWTENTISYAIGLKEGRLPEDAHYPGAVYREVSIPDSGWLRFTGPTEQLARLYAEIYEEGVLAYEIERFSEAGDCEILVIRA